MIQRLASAAELGWIITIENEKNTGLYVVWALRDGTAIGKCGAFLDAVIMEVLGEIE